jgi:CheY-like chemotaxis protein
MASSINYKSKLKRSIGNRNNSFLKKAPGNDYPTSTVLIISDNSFTILSIKHLLESKNIFVLTANNAGAAVHLLENIKTDLLLIDYNVSESNCLEVLKSIVALTTSSRVVIYSGNTNKVDENKLMEAGATCLLNMNDNENLLKTLLTFL